MQTGKQQAALRKKKTKSSKFLTKLCSHKLMSFRPVQITPLRWPSIATVFYLSKRIGPYPGHTTALITMRSIFRSNDQKRNRNPYSSHSGVLETLTTTSRNNDVIFKHLKSLNKSPIPPKQIVSGDKLRTIFHEQIDIMNEFFHSVFSPKPPFSISHIDTKNPKLTNFNISV